jgi:hypothetical protein
MSPEITTEAFFDVQTGTVTYVVVDESTRHAAIIDPVLDFNFKSGRTSSVQADKVLAFVRDRGVGRRARGFPKSNRLRSR